MSKTCPLYNLITVKDISMTFHTFVKVSKVAKIRNRYNQVPHLTQDTNPGTGIMEGDCTHNPEDWKNKSIK